MTAHRFRGFRLPARKRRWALSVYAVVLLAVTSCATVADAALDTELRASERAAATWRSSLYPEDWTPGYTNEHGLFLHDFSYAGYAMRERPIPADPPGETYTVTEARFGADPTGEEDSTAAIQRAIDAAGFAGGGVVYLPTGTYRVRPPEGEGEALSIDHSGVVLRGDGADATFLFNDETRMRAKAVIRVRPSGAASWSHVPEHSDEYRLAADAENQSTVLTLEAVDQLDSGDWITIRTDVTEGFVREFAEEWLIDHWVGRLAGPLFYRQIVDVHPDSRTVEIDIPLRYPVRVRDGGRVHRTAAHIGDVGVEQLSIGMAEHPARDGWDFNDYQERGTAAYDVHASYAAVYRHVVNGWIRDVRTYRPESNRGRYHIISNGILLNFTRNVTVANCDLRNAQYRGGGGNGYGIVLQGSDNLVQNCYGERLRYLYDFKSMRSSGNVVHRSGAASRSDFHMHLSMANLIDNLTIHNEYFYAGSRYRWGGIAHGRTTDQTVFWNTRGIGSSPDYVIDVTDQPDALIIVGTQGARTGVKGSADEYHYRHKGLGSGEILRPESLYESQLRRRMAVR